MVKTSTCPDLSVLQELAVANVRPDEMEALLSHLQACDACLAKMPTFAARDTLVDSLAKLKTLPNHPDDPLLSAVIERLANPSRSPTAEEAAKPLTFACTSCGKKLKVKAELAGKKVKCPGCGKVVPVAAEGPTSASKPGIDLGNDKTILPDAPSQAEAARPADLSNDRTLPPQAHDTKSGISGENQAKQPPPADATQGIVPDGGADDLSFLAPPQQPDELGRLERYRILKKLGAGGMGMVLLGEDTLLHRKAAIKVMLPQFSANAKARERFLREAQATASIEHEHIVPIFQVGEANQVPFLAMPLLKGEALDVCLERVGKLSTAQALRIAREMAEGLAAAHANHLIHRDIKPGNVWLEGKNARVRLLDFGLARAQDDTTHLTQTGAVVGTPAFMAPEQAGGNKIDARADLFSLGCVLYLMLTGQRPFKGNDTISVLMALAVETPEPPTLANPEVPADVSELTMRLLAKDPADRPASAEDVVAALRVLEETGFTEQPVLPSTGIRTPAPHKKNIEPSVKPRGLVAAPDWKKTAAGRRVPLLVGIGALVALLLLIAGAGGIYMLAQIIIIRDRDGKEIARIKVPEGGKVEVVEGAKPEDGKHVPWAATHEQQVWIDGVAKMPLAQQIESVNRRMGEENKVPIKLVLEPQDGPPTKCMVTPGSPVAYANAIWPLLALPSLTALDLKGTAVTDFTPLARLPLTELQANLIVDNVKSEAALKSLATLKTVNGRPVAEYWAERAEIRKDIDDRVVNARLMPFEDRMAWFIPVMKKLHPGWSEINNAKLTRDPATGWTTIYVARGPFDISPVRALGVDAIHLYATSVSDLTSLAKTKVQSFAYASPQGRGGVLRDLSPLAGLPLKQLDLSAAAGVTDLSPLTGMKLESCLLHPGSGVTDIKVLLDMPITSLALPNSITDLRPFKEMKLKSLACSTTDLSPVAGMPLESLLLGNARPADLSLLAGMKLKSFGLPQYRTHYEPDEKMLRAMPLEGINGKPAAKFWAAHEAEKKALQEFVNATAKLPPEDAVQAVAQEVSKFRVSMECRIADGAVVEAKVSIGRGFQGNNTMAQVKAFSRLKKISFASNIDGWTDLSPLMSLPIEEIEGTPAMITGNVFILRQMPTLRTINGKPAQEVLAAVK